MFANAISFITSKRVFGLQNRTCQNNVFDVELQFISSKFGFIFSETYIAFSTRNNKYDDDNEIKCCFFRFLNSKHRCYLVSVYFFCVSSLSFFDFLQMR